MTKAFVVGEYFVWQAGAWRSNPWPVEPHRVRVFCVHRLPESATKIAPPRCPPNRHGRACPGHRSLQVLATDGRDMPGHDGGTTCRWHFHPIVVPAGGLGDCAEILASRCCHGRDEAYEDQDRCGVRERRGRPSCGPVGQRSVALRLVRAGRWPVQRRGRTVLVTGQMDRLVPRR
jgi:hypothetical protein